MNWFWIACKKSVDFKGRARRREFGWFNLIAFLIGLLLGFVEGVSIPLGLLTFAALLENINSLFSLLVILPSISVTTRRLHDLGYSGWWQCLPWCLVLISAVSLLRFYETASLQLEQIPWFGAIVMGLAALSYLVLILFLLFKDGQPFTNKYGDNPKSPPPPNTPTNTSTIPSTLVQ